MRSLVAQHILENGHQMDWENTKLLNIQNNIKSWRVLESLYSKKHKSFNRFIDVPGMVINQLKNFAWNMSVKNWFIIAFILFLFLIYFYFIFILFYIYFIFIYIFVLFLFYFIYILFYFLFLFYFYFIYSLFI